MAAEPIAAAFEESVLHSRRAVLSDYWALTKPEVNFLILIATFAGFYLGRAAPWRDFPVWLAIHTLLGTLLVANPMHIIRAMMGNVVGVLKPSPFGKKRYLETLKKHARS